MPSKSKAQHNFMAAVASNPAFSKKVGVPKSVGEDYTQADKGRKFGKGGEMAKKPMFGGKETYSEELKEAKAIKSGKISPQQYAKGEKSEESKMAKKKFADGGMMPPMAGRGAPQVDPQTLAAIMKMLSGAGRGMPPGRGAPPMRPPMTAPAQPLKKGGMAKGGFTKAADGIASKGKTKATQIKMTRGGKC